ncbi:MAG: hypothetical protein A2V65_12785 [Deltaproteobacteria bacterium RBG_13_49_15]|nr:MAG: hypothetical protein A2V65_12785 [Deltaproteobacteria bacterium RBG_13_49_15]
MRNGWNILKREYPCTFRVLKIEQKTVTNPRTGETLKVQAILTPDWVMVLPITPEQEVVMVRQYRHGIEEFCLELPGGLVDGTDDSPELSARRELMEETGYDAYEFIPMGWSYPQPAILNNRGFFYLAKDAIQIRDPRLDAGEDIEVIRVPIAEIPIKIKKKEIVHGMALLAFFFLQMMDGNPGQIRSLQ